MGRFQVKLGGVYPTEYVPGTGTDPSDPTTVLFLDAVYMSIPTNGTIGELRCESNNYPEQFMGSSSSSGGGTVQSGQWVQIVDTGYNTGSGSSSSSGQVIFDGIATCRHITISGEKTNCYLVAYDHGSYLLYRTPLHGQYRRNYTLEEGYFANGKSDSPLAVYFDLDIIKTDIPLIFNPDGEPNMTEDSYNNRQVDGSQAFHIFEAPYRRQFTGMAEGAGTPLNAQYWTLKDAVTYLLNINNVNWCIDPASFTDAILDAVFTPNPNVNNINCEGKRLSDALMDLLVPHNFLYWVDPALNTNNLHDIHFFFKGTGTNISIDLATRGTLASVSEANLVHFDGVWDNAGTVNYLESYGDRIVATTFAHTNGPSSSSSGFGPTDLKLVKAWKDSDLVYAFETDGTTVNSWNTAFRQDYCNEQLITVGASADVNPGIFGVGRMFVVNLGEASDKVIEDLTSDLATPPASSSSGMPASSSSSSGLGGMSSSTSIINGANSVDPRRLVKPELYTANTAGGLLSQEDVMVELSCDNGKNWCIVDRSNYRLLDESMGIVFTSPNLELLGIDFTQTPSMSSSSSSSYAFGKGYWQALHDNTLQIRILCGVKSDQRVQNITQNNGTAFPLAIGAVYNNAGFKRNVYNDEISKGVYYTNYQPQRLAQDDTSALGAVAAAMLNNTNRTIISGQAQMLLENFGQFKPGMTVNQISNRSINMSAGNGWYPTIMQIVYKFQEQQIALTLDNHRVAPVIRAKPLDQAANERQRKLGIENPVPQSGQQVPYLPGDMASFERWIIGGGGG